MFSCGVISQTECIGTPRTVLWQYYWREWKIHIQIDINFSHDTQRNDGKNHAWCQRSFSTGTYECKPSYGHYKYARHGIFNRCGFNGIRLYNKVSFFDKNNFVNTFFFFFYFFEGYIFIIYRFPGTPKLFRLNNNRTRPLRSPVYKYILARQPRGDRYFHNLLRHVKMHSSIYNIMRIIII